MELIKSQIGCIPENGVDKIIDLRMLSTQENYTAIVDPYTEDFGDDQRNLGDFIDPMISILAENKLEGPIIDLGSGPGNIVDYLLERGVGGEIIAVDFVEGFCGNLSAKYKNNSNVEVISSDFVDYISKQTDDSVVAYTAGFSVIHIPDDKIDGLFKNVARSLKPGGLFFFSVYEGSNKGMVAEPYQKENDSRLKTTEHLEAYMNNFQSDELAARLGNVEMKAVKLVVVNDAKPGEYSSSKIFGLFQK